MRFGSVEFPSELVEARAAGTLVVFAGAGVSMPAPSNLPSFRELAIELAQGTAKSEKDEPLDRFLGRLDQGLRIHARARDRLCNPDSKPNPLHSTLLKLFDGASAVRLVTTNFDDHFAAAAAGTWPGESLEVFAAPALPFGGYFQGLVHLHGSVTRDPRRMVLTDADFGRAYLTEGWARRFLQEMFSKYVVLFVGYSHSDPVVRYLVRGLPSSTEGRRFALTPRSDDGFWKHLGIAALAYPMRRGRNSHREQATALAKWVKFTAERPLDKRERIQDIVSKSPPVAGEDHEYLVDALNNESTAQYFTEFALKLEWFEWAQGREAFLRLFRNPADVRSTDERLAWWFAEKVAIEHADTALEWIVRSGLTLGPTCWRAVAFEILRRMSSRGGCPGLDHWVPLLLQTRPERTGGALEGILSHCRYPDDATAALLLFHHSLRPVPELKADHLAKVVDPSATPGVDLDLGTVGDSYWTREAWQRYFLPNLQHFVGPLTAIAATHLEETALLSRAYGKDWDIVSMRFPDLSERSLYGEQSALGVLIDVARETLLWLIQNDRKRADGLIEAWLNAGSIVLQRLALFGVAQSAGWAADDKLCWLLERGLLYRNSTGMEVSAVLEGAFRDASPEVRDRVVAAALAGPTGDSEYRDDCIRGVLRTLKRADPDCARVAEELSRIPQPPEYVPEPEPAAPSPRDLLAGAPADKVDELLAYESRYEGWADRGGLTVAVQMAVVEKPDWGMELAETLRARGVWETDLWRSITWGWNEGALSTDQWAKVLNLLPEPGLLASSALDGVADLLERKSAGDSNPFKGALLGLAAKVGLQVWRVLDRREHERKSEAKDWLFVAINSAGGRLAEFFLRTLLQARKEAGDAWHGLTEDFRLYLEGVVRGSSWAAEMARVVVAAQLHTLFALDAQWANANMFGMFDWSADARRAQQAWHGYLTWGRWNNDLLERILPQCRKTFTDIEGRLGDHVERFCTLMASIALYGSVDPMESGWLQEFIRTASLNARKGWASALRRSLEGFPAGKRQEVWTRWMKSYWEFRVGAFPALDPGEITRMAEWSIELEEAFPEAVRLILKGPAAESGDMTDPCFRLQESGVLRRYPQESALLVRFLVRSQSRYPAGDYIIDSAKELAQLGAETAVLVDICHRLAELGDTVRAADLKRFVESQGGTSNS
jgi:hypothetical protein